MKTAKERAIFERACRFYAVMPGAVQPQQSTHIDGQLRTLWGEVDFTPEFKFCEAIAREMVSSDLAVLKEILSEREYQITGEGYTADHDDAHPHGALAMAAAAYAMTGAGMNKDLIYRQIWPWGSAAFKPTTHRRDLIRAAALIIAEIEHLDRAAAQAEKNG